MAMTNTETAGRRDTRITFERFKQTVTPDGSGHVDESNDANWGAFATRWAEVYTKGSREFYRADQVAAHVTHAVKVKYDSELSRQILTPGASRMRIRIGTRKLNIDGPINDENEQNNYLIFNCVEVR